MKVLRDGLARLQVGSCLPLLSPAQHIASLPLSMMHTRIPCPTCVLLETFRRHHISQMFLSWRLCSGQATWHRALLLSTSEALAGPVVILPSLHMQATQSTTEKQLAKTGTNLAASIAAVATLERDIKAAGDKFAFLQDMRAYIADLCDMLQVA